MPANAILLDAGVDPFYPIKPAPDIDIALEGGVRLHDSVWLAGYPPRLGCLDRQRNVKVLIDGKEAHTDDDISSRMDLIFPDNTSFNAKAYPVPGPIQLQSPRSSWAAMAGLRVSLCRHLRSSCATPSGTKPSRIFGSDVKSASPGGRTGPGFPLFVSEASRTGLDLFLSRSCGLSPRSH